MLKGTYYSYDSVKESSDENIEQQNVNHLQSLALNDYLGLLHETGVPDHVLHLQEGSLCTLQRNLSIQKGLVKNSRVLIRKLLPHLVEVQLLSENLTTGSNDYSETIFPIPRITFEFKPHYAPWTVTRKQFPLRLAYATTFNSCQGLTLDRAVIDLRTPVFAHGQLYTSLSRIRNRTDIRTLFPNSTTLHETTNIVHKQLLLPQHYTLWLYFVVLRILNPELVFTAIELSNRLAQHYIQHFEIYDYFL